MHFLPASAGMSRRRFLAGTVTAAAAGLLAPATATADGTESPELYASDYISFVGADERGRVFLAHDNNRGQTGTRFFADHWIAMFDEASGWIDVQGSAHYPNTEKRLDVIPPSGHFVFEGTSETGLSFTSTTNDMALAVGALPPILRRANDDGEFWTGAAPATLDWRGRRLEGRVIFEYLRRNNWNRFTRKFEANWRNFNGLYLLTSDGADFYMHSHERTGGSDLTGRLVGMATWDAPAPITEIEFSITDKVKGGGESQFHWPTAWRVNFSHGGRRYATSLATREKKLFAWWKTGGFRMAIIEGEITCPGEPSRKVTGWAELLI